MTTKNDLHVRLRKSGIRPSLQRMAIMEYLMNNPVHPTTDMVYSELRNSIPTLSKTTIYNTLKLLSEYGAIRSIFIDEKNFRYDADISEHAHFRCLECGKIADLPIEKKSVELKNTENLFITESHLYYRGYCEECKTKFNNLNYN